MYFDLNVPVPGTVQPPSQTQSKKSKGKQPQVSPNVTYSPTQISAIENRVDLLVHLGYTVIAFNQIEHKKIDPKTHVNVLDPLLVLLRKRPGIVFLKRLTIILDEDSEKGFGLTNGNISLVQPYDLLALAPTTTATFSLACLTHSLPSSLTAHIIALPLTLPRLSFHLKHTLVRTAIRNGAVFEIGYVGALGGESDTYIGVGEGGAGAKRNWWAAAREVVRVTKGKGIIVSGGVGAEADLRAPRDIGNLITLLGLAPNLAHDTSTTTPKSLVLRAQTRKTYRAVLSEPRIIIPQTDNDNSMQASIQGLSTLSSTPADSSVTKQHSSTQDAPPGHKRQREDADAEVAETNISEPRKEKQGEESARKKKRKNKNKDGEK